MGPVTEDAVRRWAGTAARDAIPDTTEMAEQVDRTPRTVRRWRDGRHPSPLTDFLEWLAKADDAFRIAAHVTAFAKWQRLQGKSTAELVERWHELTDMEHDLEAEENRAIANGDDADAEIRADEREAAIQTERAAVRVLLRTRRVEPRAYRRTDR